MYAAELCVWLDVLVGNQTSQFSDYCPAPSYHQLLLMFVEKMAKPLKRLQRACFCSYKLKWGVKMTGMTPKLCFKTVLLRKRYKRLMGKDLGGLDLKIHEKKFLCAYKQGHTPDHIHLLTIRNSVHATTSVWIPLPLPGGWSLRI